MSFRARPAGRRGISFLSDYHSERMWEIFVFRGAVIPNEHEESQSIVLSNAVGSSYIEFSWQEILHSTLFRSEWHVIPSEAGRPTRNLLFIWLSFRTHVRNLCFSGSCHSEWTWGIPIYCSLECSRKFIHRILLAGDSLLHAVLFRTSERKGKSFWK